MPEVRPKAPRQYIKTVTPAVRIKKQRPPDRRKAALRAFCFSLSSFPHRFVKGHDRASLGLLASLWQVTGKLNGRPGRYSRAARFFSRYYTLCAHSITKIGQFRTFCAYSITKIGYSARFPASSSTFRIARVELIFQAAVKLQATAGPFSSRHEKGLRHVFVAPRKRPPLNLTHKLYIILLSYI